MKLSNKKLRSLFEWGFPLFLGCLLLINTSCQTKIEKKTNILFCIADDVSFIHTSIQGTAEISTPNFDRVATSGVLFNNAYCNASSCAPSRASILTGKSQGKEKPKVYAYTNKTPPNSPRKK